TSRRARTYRRSCTEHGLRWTLTVSGRRSPAQLRPKGAAKTRVSLHPSEPLALRVKLDRSRSASEPRPPVAVEPGPLHVRRQVSIRSATAVPKDGVFGRPVSLNQGEVLRFGLMVGRGLR